MDFKIVYADGKGAMTFAPADSIANNIFLSLNIRKGTFFADPEFGMRELPGKNTPKSPELVEAYALEALQWILDTGRAKSITLSAYQDKEKYPDRILLTGEAIQADGRTVPFEQFVEVV